MKAILSSLKLCELVNSTKKKKINITVRESFPFLYVSSCVSEKKEFSFHQEGHCFVTKMALDLDCLLLIS